MLKVQHLIYIWGKLVTIIIYKKRDSRTVVINAGKLNRSEIVNINYKQTVIFAQISFMQWTENDN